MVPSMRFRTGKVNCPERWHEWQVGIHCSLSAASLLPGEIQREIADVAITLGQLLISNALTAFRDHAETRKD